MPIFTGMILHLMQISFLVFITKSCMPVPPPDATLYFSNVQLLDDPNYLLLTIEAFNDAKLLPYCKMFNVNDGTVSNVVSCTNPNIREWSTGDIDPTSTQILSATDNQDGTADVTLRRNNANIGITGIPYTGSGGSNLYFDQFTINSIHSTFVLLAPDQYQAEMVKITFQSQSDNTRPSAVNFGVADFSWQDWEVGNPINMIPVYQDANAIQLPLVCCLCDESFIARYYFNYDATTGDISGIEIDTTVWGGKVDDIAQNAYDYGPFFPTSINVYNLANIGGVPVTYEIDLSYSTSSPSKSPTKYPTTTPTEITQPPSNVPSSQPSEQPSISPTTTTMIETTEEGNGGGSGKVQLRDNNASSGGFIFSMSETGSWTFVAVGVLILCFLLMICFYCLHSRKLKQRIKTLEQSENNNSFCKMDSVSPVPNDTQNTNNFDTPITDNTNAVVVVNAGEVNNDTDEDMYELGSNEGALPLQPNVNETAGAMYQFSSDENILDEKETEKEENSDNDDMYNDKAKTFLSVEDAKQLNVPDKEAYLEDTDFQSVFGMTKDVFYKYPVWKQKSLKKRYGFF